MYTARELFDHEDYEYVVHYTEKKENWTLIKEPTKKKRRLTLSGRQIFDDKLINGTWNGKDYLIHFDECHNLPNNWGGFGYATEKTDWLLDYDTFVDYLDSHVCNHIPGYVDDVEFQMTLF